VNKKVDHRELSSAPFSRGDAVVKTTLTSVIDIAYFQAASRIFSR
jgi:hypothetical protein